MKPIAILLPAVLFTVLLAACASTGDSVQRTYFSEYVKPVFEQHCLRCHTGEHPPAGLNLSNSTRALASKHRSGRVFIVPGKPDQSVLLSAIGRKGSHPKVMPRADISLTEDQIGELREWIEDGAHWPKASAGELHHVATGENR
jgi:hypothetical protein